MQNEKLVTAGGRVFGVVGSGKDLSEALRQAYEACEKVNFKNKYYRRDIGKKGLERCSK